MEKVLLYGVGKRCRKIIETFPEFKDYVDGFVDSYAKLDELYGMPVYKPEIFEGKSFKNKTVVVTALDYYNEIYSLLRNKFKLEHGQILHTREWLADILLNSNILIQPPSVRLESSTLCQLNCTGCYMRKNDSGTVGKGYLPFDDFKKFIENNTFIKRIEISNSGEPFLNPDIGKILEYAGKKEIEITILGGTNFNDVPDEVLEALVKYKAKEILISIDGASQHTYEIYRRNGNFNKVINNIEKLNSYKQKYHSEFPLLIWQFILMKHNEQDAGIAKEMAGKLNMKIQYKLDWEENFIPQNPEKLHEISGIKFFNRSDYNQNHSQIYSNDFCANMIFNPQVNWDDRLLGCCCVYQNDWNVNVFNEGLTKALQEKKYRNAVISLLGGAAETEKDTPCGQCNIFYQIVNEKNYIEI